MTSFFASVSVSLAVVGRLLARSLSTCSCCLRSFAQRRPFERRAQYICANPLLWPALHLFRVCDWFRSRARCFGPCPSSSSCLASIRGENYSEGPVAAIRGYNEFFVTSEVYRSFDVMAKYGRLGFEMVVQFNLWSPPCA